MGLFKKKNIEDKLSYKKEMSEKIVRNSIKYVTERIQTPSNPSGKEEVICHAGRCNIMDDCLIISSNGLDIFKGKINDLKMSELYSKEGCIVTGYDLFHEGKLRTIIVYYTYYL